MPQPITDASCDTDADYVGSLLSTSTAASTSAAQLVNGFIREGFQRYRLIVEAEKPTTNAVGHLLVRITNIHDDNEIVEAADHAYMRLDLTNSTPTSSSGVVSASGVDLGGGRFRYTMYVDTADDATAASCVVEIRLVDSSSDSLDADVGDGAYVYVWHLSSRCKDTA